MLQERADLQELKDQLVVQNAKMAAQLKDIESTRCDSCQAPFQARSTILLMGWLSNPSSRSTLHAASHSSRTLSNPRTLVHLVDALMDFGDLSNVD